MIVRCYGARGSIPVSGPEYSKYGGDTSCLEIVAQSGETIIVDAGTGIRRLGERIMQDGRAACNLFFTHAHWDHIIGFPFFRPIYHDGMNIKLYGCPLSKGDMRSLVSATMASPCFPIPFANMAATMSYQGVCPPVQSIGSVEVRSIALSHPNRGLGFRFTENGRSVVFLTDNELGFRHQGGCSFDDYAAFAQGADLVIHDAEFTAGEYERTKGWGHSTYNDALRLALAADAAAFGLFHHNQGRTDVMLDDILRDCRTIVSDAGRTLSCFALSQTWETSFS